MKLKLSKRQQPIHSEIVSTVCWSGNNTLYSVSDDKTIQKWDSNGENLGIHSKLNEFVTAFAVSPASRSNPETFAAGNEFGEIKIFTGSPEDAKPVEAHQAAVLDIKWSKDGNTLATSGEDGQVRVHS